MKEKGQQKEDNNNEATPQKSNSNATPETAIKETQSQSPIKPVENAKLGEMYKLKLRDDFNPLTNSLVENDEKLLSQRTTNQNEGNENILVARE
jgi:hypothetical protein